MEIAMNQIQDLIARRALFVISHSGGKDSQAQMIRMLEILPADYPRELIVVVHASLGRFEWNGALELAERQAADAGVAFRVARAIHKDGSEKDFRTMAERRHADRPDAPAFPSASCRQCTSDLKRGPIEKVIKAYMKEHGFKLVVNCVGIRGGESDSRAECIPFVYENENLNSKGEPKSGLVAAGRQVWSWLPIFDLSDLDVFCMIRSAGQFPHQVYDRNERLSCVFCIMGSENDILHGSIARPELFAELVELEQTLGYTMHQKNRLSLTEIVAKARGELSQAA